MGLNKQVLLIDMDGVVADFDDAYKKSLEKTPGIKFPQSQYKFFENIEPIKDSIKSIKELEEYYDILILTRPSVINPLSYTEKRIWIEKYFGFDMCKKLILCYDKTMVNGNHLIDDNIQTGRYNPTWNHIHFGKGNFKNWKNITVYLKNMFYDV